MQELAVVDAVQRQQVHVVQPQILQRRVKRAQEFLWQWRLGLTLV